MSPKGSTSSEVEMLGRRILESHPDIAWVTVLDENGETLFHGQGRGHPPMAKIGKETRARLGFIDAVFLKAFTQGEKWYGKMDFVVLAFRTTKVMLMRDRRRNLYLAMRMPRSGNATYLHHRIEAVLNE